jgi:catalase (peroxidase I)
MPRPAPPFLGPQKDWEANSGSATALDRLEAIQREFNAALSGGKRV